MKIEILQEPIDERKGIARSTNKPYHMRMQNAYLHNDNRYPVRFQISLRDQQQPYAAGMYELEPDAIYVDRDNRLAIFPRLKPAAKAQAA